MPVGGDARGRSEEEEGGGHGLLPPPDLSSQHKAKETSGRMVVFPGRGKDKIPSLVIFPSAVDLVEVATNTQWSDSSTAFKCWRVLYYQVLNDYN